MLLLLSDFLNLCLYLRSVHLLIPHRVTHGAAYYIARLNNSPLRKKHLAEEADTALVKILHRLATESTEQFQRRFLMELALCHSAVENHKSFTGFPTLLGYFWHERNKGEHKAAPTSSTPVTATSFHPQLSLSRLARSSPHTLPSQSAAVPFALVTRFYSKSLMVFLSIVKGRRIIGDFVFTCFSIIKDIAMILRDLHALGLVHGNLNLDTIFIQEQCERPRVGGCRPILGELDRSWMFFCAADEKLEGSGYAQCPPISSAFRQNLSTADPSIVAFLPPESLTERYDKPFDSTQISSQIGSNCSMSRVPIATESTTHLRHTSNNRNHDASPTPSHQVRHSSASIFPLAQDDSQHRHFDYVKKRDVYAFAVIAQTLLTLTTPFGQHKNQAVSGGPSNRAHQPSKQSNSIPFIWPVGVYGKLEMVALLDSCLHPSPAIRPDFDFILQQLEMISISRRQKFPAISSTTRLGLVSRFKIKFKDAKVGA